MFVFARKLRGTPEYLETPLALLPTPKVLPVCSLSLFFFFFQARASLLHLLVRPALMQSSSSIGAAGAAAVDAGKFVFRRCCVPRWVTYLGLLKPPWGIIGADRSSLTM